MDKIADTLRMLANQIDKKDGSVIPREVRIERDFSQYAGMQISLDIDLSKIEQTDLETMNRQIGAGQ